MKEAGKLTDVELAELRQIYADCKAIIVNIILVSKELPNSCIASCNRRSRAQQHQTLPRRLLQ